MFYIFYKTNQSIILINITIVLLLCMYCDYTALSMIIVHSEKRFSLERNTIWTLTTIHIFFIKIGETLNRLIFITIHMHCICMVLCYESIIELQYYTWKHWTSPRGVVCIVSNFRVRYLVRFYRFQWCLHQLETMMIN